MAVFTVHQPPLRKTESTPEPTRFTFVRDGFYFWGFVFSALWMLRHRLWLVAVLFVALSVLIQIGLKLLGAPSAFHTIVAVALAFLVGLEGATLRRWTLARRGWTNVGVVIADNEDDAERRFFVNWQAGRRPNAAPPPADAGAVVRMGRSNAAPDVIGSFPQPEPPR
jgi:hypothetical protein